MANQEAMSAADGLRHDSSPPSGMVGSLSEFGNDVATLAELQAKLVALDLKESAQQALVPTILIGSAAVLLMASLPVALIGAAELLATALRLDQRGWAYLIVAAVVAVASAIVAALAGRRLGHSFDSLRRSREELTRNIAWIRTVLTQSSRVAARR